jgi:putative ATP-dependent endonuclease of OLD family
VDEKVKADFKNWNEKGWDNERIAFEIYNNTQLRKNISKSIVSQCFSDILERYPDRKGLKNKLISDPNFKYIIDAIIYATSGKVEKEASDD